MLIGDEIYFFRLPFVVPFLSWVKYVWAKRSAKMGYKEEPEKK